MPSLALDTPLNAVELAEKIGGVLRRGDGFVITGICTPEEPEQGCACFVWNRKNLKNLKEEKLCVITGEDLSGEVSADALIIHSNPRAALARFLETLQAPWEEVNPPAERVMLISPGADVSPDAEIFPFVYISDNVKVGRGTKIFPFCYIGPDTEIGENCTIFPGVVIYGRVKIGNNVRVHSGCAIGTDGFGYERGDKGWVKIPHRGRVIIEDHVELGAGVKVDRGTIGDTVIGEGAKVDNLVQIAHNVKIGKRVLIAAQTGISGSTVIEDDCIIAGQVGFVDRVKVGRGSMIAPQSGVHANVPPGNVYSGTPAIPHSEWLKAVSVFRRLPEMRERLREVERLLGALQEEKGEEK